MNRRHIRETQSSSFRFKSQEWSSQTAEGRPSILGGAFPYLCPLSVGEYGLSLEMPEGSPVTPKCLGSRMGVEKSPSHQ